MAEANMSKALGVRRFLVTGGAGFVGSHIVAVLRDHGEDVAVLGRRPPLDVYGADYSTADGTCVRDYVHVTDRADAHLLALSRLDSGPGVTWNLGSGTGHSVPDVIRSVERISGREVPYRIAARRPGDPAVLVAASDRARAAGWRPRHEALDDIVPTAFAWREAHPGGYGGS
jgi:UDP-glucose 4-epimerase